MRSWIVINKSLWEFSSSSFSKMNFYCSFARVASLYAILCSVNEIWEARVELSLLNMCFNIWEKIWKYKKWFSANIYSFENIFLWAFTKVSNALGRVMKRGPKTDIKAIILCREFIQGFDSNLIIEICSFCNRHKSVFLGLAI